MLRHCLPLGSASFREVLVVLRYRDLYLFNIAHAHKNQVSVQADTNYTRLRGSSFYWASIIVSLDLASAPRCAARAAAAKLRVLVQLGLSKDRNVKGSLLQLK